MDNLLDDFEDELNSAFDNGSCHIEMPLGNTEKVETPFFGTDYIPPESTPEMITAFYEWKKQDREGLEHTFMHFRDNVYQVEEDQYDDMAMSLAADQEFNDGVPPGTYTSFMSEYVPDEKEIQEAYDYYLNGTTSHTSYRKFKEEIFPDILKMRFEKEEEQPIDDVELYFQSGGYDNQVEIIKQQLIDYANEPEPESVSTPAEIQDRLKQDVNYDVMTPGLKELQQMNGVRDHGMVLHITSTNAPSPKTLFDELDEELNFEPKQIEPIKAAIDPVNPEVFITQRVLLPKSAADQDVIETTIVSTSTISQVEFNKQMEKVLPLYNVQVPEENPDQVKKPVLPSTIDLQPDFLSSYTKDKERVSIRLTVLGDPQAQKRSRSKLIPGQKFAMHYDPSEGDKDNFRQVIQQNAPSVPWEGPLRLDVYFFFARPKAHYNSKGAVKENAALWKISKPDRDNLDKFVMDAMTKVFFNDDSQVCAGEIIKMYDQKPRTEIILTKL